MDAKRLEDLAELCDSAIADTSSGFGAYFDAQDIADLARCARAWAKVRNSGDGGWLFMVDQFGASMDSGFTQDGYECPIEAVESAEGKP